MLSFALIISNKYFIYFHSAHKTDSVPTLVPIVCTLGPISVTTIHQRLVLSSQLTFITVLDLANGQCRGVRPVSLCRGCDTKCAASGIGNHHILDSGHFRLQPGQFRLEMDVFLGLFADDD